MSASWDAAEQEWLSTKSSSTRRAYLADVAEFLLASGGYPWQTNSDDIKAWFRAMRRASCSAAVIRRRLSAVRSFYSHVITRYHLDQPDDHGGMLPAGTAVMVHPFDGAAGLVVPSGRRAGQGQLDAAVIRRALGLINRDCVTGARDYALILTLLLSGQRSGAVLALRLGDIPVDEATVPAPDRLRLPVACRSAITAYLAWAGRGNWADPRRAAEYVWTPLELDGLANFPNVDLALYRVPEARHIGGSRANAILRKRLRAAGIEDADEFQLADLRHAFARQYLETHGDVAGLRHELRHSSERVTRQYVRQQDLGCDADWDAYGDELHRSLGL